MVPDHSKTCLGMEYFCSVGEDLWEMSDADLIKLASQEAIALGIGVKAGDVEDGVVIRQRKAYPVYDAEYRQHLQVIQDYLETFDNLQTVGRNGMHRYNNQDHSMLTAMLAVRNLFGENHDLWTVNTERSYHEEFTVEDQKNAAKLSSVLRSNSEQPKAAIQSLVPSTQSLKIGLATLVQKIRTSVVKNPRLCHK